MQIISDKDIFYLYFRTNEFTLNYTSIIFSLVFALDKCTEALSATSKESGVEANMEKSKYMFISHYQNNGKIIAQR
jgi:hypothetical protein